MFKNSRIPTQKIFKKLDKVTMIIPKNFEKLKQKKNAPGEFDALKYFRSIRISKVNKNRFFKKNSLKKEFSIFKSHLKIMIDKSIKENLLKGFSVNTISKFLNVDYQRVYRMSLNHKNANSENINNSYSVSINQTQMSHDKRNKINNQLLKAFSKFINSDNNNFLTLKEIKSKFEKFYLETYCELINLSLTTYHRILSLKKFFNLSFKKIPKYTIYYSNSEKEKLKRLMFCRLFLYYKEQGYSFIFIDETGVNHSLHPDKGWGPKGRKLVPQKVKIKQEENFSLIIALNQEEILGFQFIDGGVRGADFYSFISAIIKKKNLLNQKYMIILDNGRMHQNRLFNKANLFFNFLYLPPYCPYMNAVEYCFCHVKREIKKKFYEGRAELISSIIDIINDVDKMKIDSFNKSIYKYIELFLEFKNL